MDARVGSADRHGSPAERGRDLSVELIVLGHGQVHAGEVNLRLGGLLCGTRVAPSASVRTKKPVPRALAAGLMPIPVSAMVQRQTALPFSSDQSSKVVVILPLGRLYLMQLL